MTNVNCDGGCYQPWKFILVNPSNGQYIYACDNCVDELQLKYIRRKRMFDGSWVYLAPYKQTSWGDYIESEKEVKN